MNTFTNGDRVRVVTGDNKGDEGVIEAYDKLDNVYVVKLIQPAQLYGMMVRYTPSLLERVDVFEGLSNVVELPKPTPKFEHKHQLRINGYYLEFTHKELRELSLMLRGLLNE